jgi:hypothetical protein
MEITDRQHAIIVGTLFGDGLLERNGRYVRLRVGHGLNQKEYLWWKYYELQELATDKPRIFSSYHKITKRNYEGLIFSTYSSPELEKYWKAFYPNGKKIVTRLACELLQDPLSLAVWHMDDGYKRNDCNALRLNTDAFAESGQKLLQNILEKRFGVAVNLHRKGKWWNIYIPQSEAKKFTKLVSPYILPALRYKIALAP